MIVQGYDDNRIFGTLNQTCTTRIGRIGAREYVRIVVLLLRCSDTGHQLVPYGHILRDKLSHIKSKKMMQIQETTESQYCL